MNNIDMNMMLMLGTRYDIISFFYIAIVTSE